MKIKKHYPKTPIPDPVRDTFWSDEQEELYQELQALLDAEQAEAQDPSPDPDQKD